VPLGAKCRSSCERIRPHIGPRYAARHRSPETDWPRNCVIYMRKFKVEGFKAGLQEESYGNYRKPEFMLDSSHLAIGRFAALNLIREDSQQFD
jgi:hypothetical protein